MFKWHPETLWSSRPNSGIRTHSREGRTRWGHSYVLRHVASYKSKSRGKSFKEDAPCFSYGTSKTGTFGSTVDMWTCTIDQRDKNSISNQNHKERKTTWKKNVLLHLFKTSLSPMLHPTTRGPLRCFGFTSEEFCAHSFSIYSWWSEQSIL